MARFAVTVPVAAPVPEVWAAITDWPSHSAWIPLTRVSLLSARPDGIGAEFVGRSGVGPLAFDDPMVVTDWSPPDPAGGGGYCRVRKTGSLLSGSASFRVEAAPGGSSLWWEEDVGIRPVGVTRFADPLVSVVGRLLFRQALRGFARTVTAARP